MIDQGGSKKALHITPRTLDVLCANPIHLCILEHGANCCMRLPQLQIPKEFAAAHSSQ